MLSGQVALRQMRIDEAIAAFQRALKRDGGIVAAHLGLYEALQVKGERRLALVHQREALRRQQFFVEKPAPSGAPTMLIVAVPGDWQANVPLEFLYPYLNLGLQKLFVGGELGFPEPATLACDVVFNAVAHSEEAVPVLDALETWLPKLGRPMLNRPERVRPLSRNGVARDFAGVSGLVVTGNERVARDAVSADAKFPIVIRPVGSQAGAEFSKIDDDGQLRTYLASASAAEFYVAPFIDYRNEDGFYRKYRIIFVDGVPYPQHLAISQRWMVHYYNALNNDLAWIREEEERFLADIASVFNGPRGAVLEELAHRVGLDYFGIDCGVLDDGRVVLFEIDPAMVVHLGDPVELFPYKQRYVPRIPQALEALVIRTAKPQSG